MYFAARTIAGAVFFATGSDNTAGAALISESCIRTFDVCFVFVMLIIFS